jgi:hypothetical protein
MARRLRRALVAAALPLAAWSFAAPAHADDVAAQDIAQARQLGQQAQASYDAGNFAESEKLWNAATRLYAQAPTLTLGLARTQAKLGKFVAAQESYNRIIREWANNAAAPQPFKDAVEAAKSEVTAVSAKVATITVTVEGPTNPLVTLDGQAVPSAALGLKRPVDPGPHKIAATADGYKPAEAAFSVAEGGTAAATLKMEKASGAVVAGAAAPAAEPGAPASEPGADTGGKSSNKTLALVAFGVGGAGLLVGAITGLVAVGKAGDLKDQCNADNKCPATAQDTVDGYKSMGMISTIGFVIAGVGGIAGAVLWFTAPKQTATAGGSRYATVPVSHDRGVSLTPYFGGTSAGVTGRF